MHCFRCWCACSTPIETLSGSKAIEHWDPNFQYLVTPLSTPASTSSSKRKTCIIDDPTDFINENIPIAWTLMDLVMASKLLGGVSSKLCNFSDEYETRRVYSMVYDVFRCKLMLIAANTSRRAQFWCFFEGPYYFTPPRFQSVWCTTILWNRVEICSFFLSDCWVSHNYHSQRSFVLGMIRPNIRCLSIGLMLDICATFIRNKSSVYMYLLSSQLGRFFCLDNFYAVHSCYANRFASIESRLFSIYCKVTRNIFEYGFDLYIPVVKLVKKYQQYKLWIIWYLLGVSWKGYW